MTRTACPADAELLRWIDGDPGAAGLQEHLDGCPRCRAYLARLEAAAQVLREVAAPAVPSNGFGPVPPGMPPGPGDTTSAEDTGTPNARDGTVEDEEPVPATIGKYPVVGILGRGGQAVVYRGLHPMLHIDVAIRVGPRTLTAGQVDRTELARVLGTLAGLDHPNLVRVHDLDVDAAGRPFLVMDLVRGCNLRQHAEPIRPDPRSAAALVAAVARGVATAHRKNLTHGDIKPENILIDEAGRPRLIDFGLARLRDAWAQEPGPAGGTLAFMAPEQARGEAAGAHSDIFALGGVLYFLLTGIAPFAGRDRGEALSRARRCDFDQTALRAARVPHRLERICLRAMAAPAADRYPVADELASDLERFARRRRPPLAAAAIVAALLGTVGVAAWMRSGIPRPTPTPTIVAPLPRATPPAPITDTVPPPAEVAPSPAPPVAPLRITEMEILHYRGNLRLGRFGFDSFAGRHQDDCVRVHAVFNAPAFCYLIALNPDGTVQFCPPKEEGTPPRLLSTLTYPTGETVFGLTDGAGLQAFVLLASREPLTSYAEWKAQQGDVPWETTHTAEGVWQFDGESFEPLGQSRGQEQPLDCPKWFVDACRTLQGRPDIHAIRALAFPVIPPGQRPAPEPVPESADRR